MESVMSHHDTDHLLTPLATLKVLLAPIDNAGTENVDRHGNASLSNLGVAICALLTFGWNQQ